MQHTTTQAEHIYYLKRITTLTESLDGVIVIGQILRGLPIKHALIYTGTKLVQIHYELVNADCPAQSLGRYAFNPVCGWFVP